MESRPSFRTVIFAVIAALSVIGAVLFFLGISGDFEPEFGYFVHGSTFAPIIYAVLISGPVIGLIFAASKKGTVCAERSLPGNGGKLMKALTALLGVSIAVSTAMEFMDVVNSAPAKYAVVTYVAWALAELSVVHYIRTVFVHEDEASPLTCISGFLPPLFYASKVLVSYFDRSIAVNSPVQIICQIALISAMLTFTAETGIVLGRKKLFKKYVFMLCTTIVICSVFGLGSIICLLAGAELHVTWATAILICASAVYSAGRLLSLASYKTNLSSEMTGGESAGSGETSE